MSFPDLESFRRRAQKALVNIGTEENPIFVPEKALDRKTELSRAWWGRVVDGSVCLEGKVADRLLRILAILDILEVVSGHLGNLNEETD